jgi:hypothetical protein
LYISIFCNCHRAHLCVKRTGCLWLVARNKPEARSNNSVAL